MHRKTKLRLADLNPCLTCRLCGGYYVDACTIQECLHSFCKSCIVRYLETKKNCPVCRVLIHKTRPLQNVRPDPTLQDVVYKLVPGILKNEMIRRRRFYAEHPCTGPEGNPTWSEDRGDIIDPERAIFMEDDKISVALIHSPDGKPAPDSTGSIIPQEAQGPTSAGTEGQTLGTCYLFCPAMVTIGVLKKLIRYKFDLHPVEDLIDIFQSDESLSEEYTLMDIVYLYTWRRQGPLCLFYTIYKFRPVFKHRLSELAAGSKESKASPSQPMSGTLITIAGHTAAAAPSADDDDDSAQEEPLNMSKKRRLDAALGGAGAAVAGDSSCWVQQGGAVPALQQQPHLLQRQASFHRTAAVVQQLPAEILQPAVAIGPAAAGMAVLVGRPLAAPAASVTVKQAGLLAKATADDTVVGAPLAARPGLVMFQALAGSSSCIMPEQGISGGGCRDLNGGASQAYIAPGIASSYTDEDEAASALNLCISKR